MHTMPSETVSATRKRRDDSTREDEENSDTSSARPVRRRRQLDRNKTDTVPEATMPKKSEPTSAKKGSKDLKSTNKETPTKSFDESICSPQFSSEMLKAAHTESTPYTSSAAGTGPITPKEPDALAAKLTGGPISSVSADPAFGRTRSSSQSVSIAANVGASGAHSPSHRNPS